MATFKVNDRVRVLPHRGVLPAGTEATVVGVHSGYCDLRLDVALRGFRDGWHAMNSVLTPLVPPDLKADAFLATVKSWGPLKEQPKTPEEVLAEIIKEAK